MPLRRERDLELSTGNGDAQESEQGVLAVEFCHGSRCKKSRR